MNTLLRHWLTAMLVLGWSLTALAQERIIAFDSDIAIAPDGAMVVTETIRVQAENARIQRGIYRDFPTRYRDTFGNRYAVDFNVLSVTRDGVTETWRTENQSNGVRVYIGNAAVIIPRGEHEYRLSYRTARQLGFFAEHDELYWNVTGNGWDFVIEQASALIHLPVDVPVDALSATAYTGPMGATGRNYSTELLTGAARFASTRPLAPGEGLTVVLSWPKGIIAEPTRLERGAQLLSDNTGLLIALVVALLNILYLYKVWSRIGRDPEAGVIFPHYEPPEGFSPAAMRYIARRSYDNKVFTAAVVNLAVKGHLRISQAKKKFSLEKLRSATKLARGETVVMQELFRKSSQLTLGTYNDVFSRATGLHRASLRRDYLNSYFTLNARYLLPSLLVTVAALIGLGLGGAVTILAGLVLVATMLLHGLFLYLLQAPTAQGRQLLDKLEGFKLYLTVAEKDDLNLQHPPDLTPELFERYLPYAVALGVEQEWSEKFAKALAAMGAAQAASYHPMWYSGNFNVAKLGDFSHSVGSQLSSAISASATPPGSSSGSSGGSSGGGGGGGGGGGW